MGSGPLDHPELRDVERLLDQSEVGEAQRVLAPLGLRGDLSEGVAYLTTRMLYARGKLDAKGVVERLQDLLARSPNFPEAEALFERAATGTLPVPAKGFASVVPSAPPAATETVRASPRAPALASDERAGPSNDRPAFSPIPELDTFIDPLPNPGIRSSRPAERNHPGLPEIPRAPAVPQFRENAAAPSYAPKPSGNVEPRKSQLPRDAGRYSAAPNSVDVLDRKSQRPSQRPSKPPSTFPPSTRGRETVPGIPERIQRSSTPSRSSERTKTPNPLPSLFEVARWIDAGQSREAIAAINRAGPSAGPGYAVLRARALAAAGYPEQSLDAIARLEDSYALDPELRAACARLLVELGNPARGLAMATRALDADANRPLVRITFALAAIRTARRNQDDVLIDRAEQALERLRGREGPFPALYQALRACVEARTGDPERALSSATRALGLDPVSADALAATAEALARLGRIDEARKAWNQLYGIAPAEAEALVSTFARSGVGVRDPAVAPTGAAPVQVWEPAELSLANGDLGAPQRSVEAAATDIVRRMVKPASQSGFTAIASVAATFLTTTPVLSCFAPFDLSLHGVLRVEAALDVLYGGERSRGRPQDQTGLILLLGTYLGESLRLAHRGRWEGNLIDLESMHVTTPSEEWFPFRSVAAYMHDGRARGSLRSAFRSALSSGNRIAWEVRNPSPASPTAPWDPRPWPAPSQVATIGRSLRESPIGRYCEHLAEGPLDNTTASLIALDSYLSLIAPRDAPVDADSAWARKISVLAGGYVGETLRELIGGEWIFGVDEADDALAFKLRLRGTIETFPVAHVLERVIGERSSNLVDYAKTMMRRAGRS